MILDTSSKRIRAFLAAAPAANQPHYVADYADHTATTFAPANGMGTLNGVTPVEVVPAPGSGQRQVRQLNIFNVDTAAVTVTVEEYDGGNQRTIIKVTLEPGEQIGWSNDRGWIVLDAAGVLKSEKLIGAYLAQEMNWYKTTSRTAVAAMPFSVFDIAGNPGAGALAVGNTANGIVPTDALAGYLPVNTPNGIGYLGRLEYGWTVPGRLHLYDCLFSAGAFAFNADITLASQPSFASRVPNLDYKGLELWLEAVTAFTLNLSAQINYLDQDGGAGDSGAISTGAALIVGRMFRMPLAAGDAGISRLDRVRGSVASAGTFNVHLMRKLWSGRVKIANDGGMEDLLKANMKRRVYDTSAFRVVPQPDSTATGLMQVAFEIADLPS